MAERSVTHLWVMRAGFVGLAMLIIFFHLIPLDTVPRRWAPPDFLMAFTLAWVLRRPDYAPALSVALVMLMADLMFQRPPGLFAVLVVLGSEYLKARAASLGEAGFLGEWALVCIVIIAITIANRLVLSVLLVGQPSLGLGLTQMLLTIVVYPVVVLITQSVLGIRKPALNDGRSFGGRA
ncbi:rod shape-determining protein MreD [Arenibacterium sp. CAU 1754]